MGWRRIFVSRQLGRFALAAAAGAAAIYGGLAGLYIVVSSRLAFSAARGADELARIETAKGLGFVLVTSLGLFGVVWLALRWVVSATAELERSRAAFLAAERRATAARFAASIVHDFNNLLQVVEGVTSALEDADERVERVELTKELEGAAARAKELARRLFEVVRGDDTREAVECLDLVELVGDSLRLLSERVFRGDTPALRAPPRLEAHVHPTLVRQIVVNLVLNARDAVDGKGRVEVELDRRGDRVLIAVDDDGPGVPPEERTRIFDAFHTTKDHGTGLGLVSVRACAEHHGGTVRVLDSPLGGARFEVEIAEA